ncbi:polysaccharide biosynthesis protein [Fulvivirga lutea]|uniref:polysaccharide biosynthesis protein n=1 Tax=Fulvivirga lutea TaxID=2810512 RepID=UPI001F3A68A1|nr:nucleoside-diphosphate sugar epimerase/dehydratase [Fulvivirga lutea]
MSISTFLGFLLRFNFEFNELQEFNYVPGIIVNTLFALITITITKSYAGIIRYTGIIDGIRLLKSLFITLLLTTFSNLIYFYFFEYNYIPNSVIFISFLASFLFMFSYRLLIKSVFIYYGATIKRKTSIAIYGAGQMGLITKHLVDDDQKSEYKIAAFFEDDATKVGKEINGSIIYSFASLNEIKEKYNIKELIIAINNISIKRKNEIVDKCLVNDIKVRKVPDLNSWVKGELSINQIREIDINELLERDSISLNNQDLIDQLKNKVICITGGAGSIGSELVRQLLAYNPKKLIIIDQAESDLFELINELNSDIISYHIADITNELRISAIFETYNPEIVYHTAAYKHVPLMENNPFEAIICNVFGTQTVAKLSIKYNVERFVMVSTDKAVNPTNIMGASKRIAEMYVQSLDAHHSTAFITTRFGNVLGSNGSVIPFFKKQIKKGGPITVTHPEITRYFMTISEACELILEAGCMGKGGEIFIFDMGESVKIVDLAKKMIKLSGFEPFKDIDIVYTGLRNGEKLFEELLIKGENNLPTHHPKIMIASTNVPNHESISKDIDQLLYFSNRNEEFNMVSMMKKLVPEYKSNSSIYQVLDK